MVALRSLDKEFTTSAWRHELNRRYRNSHVCNVCGYSRDDCTCRPEVDVYLSGGGESEGSPE